MSLADTALLVSLLCLLGVESLTMPSCWVGTILTQPHSAEQVDFVVLSSGCGSVMPVSSDSGRANSGGDEVHRVHALSETQWKLAFEHNHNNVETGIV